MELLDYATEINKQGIHILNTHVKLEITSPMGVLTHVVELTPMGATCDTMRNQETAEYEAILWAIDFDKWQHSWHHEVKPENYNHFLEIIQGKVIEKSEALVKLNAIALFLQSRIKQLNDEGIATVKSEAKLQQEDKDYEPF